MLSRRDGSACCTGAAAQLGGLHAAVPECHFPGEFERRRLQSLGENQRQ